MQWHALFTSYDYMLPLKSTKQPHLSIQVKVSNYWEAIGVIAAHKAGVLPDALRRNRIGNICSVSVAPHNGSAVSSFASSA